MLEVALNAAWDYLVKCGATEEDAGAEGEDGGEGGGGGNVHEFLGTSLKALFSYSVLTDTGSGIRPARW